MMQITCQERDNTRGKREKNDIKVQTELYIARVQTECHIAHVQTTLHIAHWQAMESTIHDKRPKCPRNIPTTHTQTFPNCTCKLPHIARTFVAFSRTSTSFSLSRKVKLDDPLCDFQLYCTNSGISPSLSALMHTPANGSAHNKAEKSREK